MDKKIICIIYSRSDQVNLKTEESQKLWGIRKKIIRNEPPKADILEKSNFHPFTGHSLMKGRFFE
jgi:hypothetical protein